MSQEKSWQKIKKRIESDPNTPRCGRCGAWMLPGSRNLLCGRCRGELGGPWLLIALELIALVLLLGVKWIVDH